MITVKIAGYLFNIDNKYEYTARLCAGYTSEGSGYAISVTGEEINREQTGDYGAEYLESLAVYRKIVEYLADHNILLIHGSAVAVDGRAYVFLAKSGTGKSTHTRLWREMLGDKAVMVNDDKPLVEITENGAVIHGTPWNGKHHLGTNISVPLAAVCFLNRGEVNKAEPITPEQGYPLLLQRTYRSRDIAKLHSILHLSHKLAYSVKLYSLSCNMEPDAARVSYNAMKQILVKEKNSETY